MSATSFVSNGCLLDYTPSAAAAAGDIAFVGGLCGQVVTDLAADQQGAIRVEGVIKVSKASGTVFAKGENVYWDAASELAVTDSTKSYMGIAVGGGANGQIVVDVLLNVQTGSRTLKTRVSAAEVNAGKVLLPAVSGRRYRVHDVALVAVGGNASGAMTVDILGTQATASVKLLAAAVAGLTANALLRAGATNAAILAGAASFAANDTGTAVSIGKTGSDLATATHVEVLMTYSVE